MRTATLAQIPVIQHILQATGSLRHHPLIVDLDGDDAGTLGLRGVGPVHVDVQLSQHGGTLLDGIPVGVPRLDDELDGLVEAIGRAAGEDDLRPVEVGHRGVQVVARELADEGEQGRVARGGAVLESRGEVDLLEGVVLGVGLGDRDVRGDHMLIGRRG